MNSTYLKARLKDNGVFDVLSMSLFSMSQLPDWYFVSLINSEFISLYVDNFINNTSHFQINDARQLPVVIPDNDTYNKIKEIAEASILIKKNNTISSEQYELEHKLLFLQKELDDITMKLYSIK